jgi:hypothetical protein
MVMVVRDGGVMVVRRDGGASVSHHHCVESLQVLFGADPLVPPFLARVYQPIL